MRVEIKEHALFKNIINKKMPGINLPNINGITTMSDIKMVLKMRMEMN